MIRFQIMSYDNTDDVERLLISDGNYKKRVGRSVFNRASRLGYIRGGVKTPYDFMSRKERKNLNGVVMVSNIYENIDKIPKMDDILKMHPEEAARVLKINRDLHSNVELCKHWGISTGKLYNVLEKFGLHTPNKGSKPRRSSHAATNNDNVNYNNDKNTNSNNETNELLKVLINKLDTDTNENNSEIENGFCIEFHGEYAKEIISDKILAISEILSNDKNYDISLSIKEL